ncbi:hypothetical protein V5O48_001138 [Marasmius crinis-equi]|uniref:Alpha/beta-hydrolase n=1 Tax=Marasmius crinis-equi TaxID=585013 RepID=A0ABR3FZ65_9AGAR
MNRRRFAKGLGFIAIGLLLCACGALFHPTFQRDPTELSVEIQSVEGDSKWSESSWSKIKPTKKLKWVDCYPGGFQCGRLQVPLDYNDPKGEAAAIALIRLRANVSTDSEEYRGPVLFNPGGPGGSGVDMVRGRGDKFATILGPQFDIVGFDPRGVSRSTPRVSFYESRVERELWARENNHEMNMSSETVGSIWARNRVTGRLAGQRDDNVLAHINTDHTARDMLTITEAHGKKKLQYWGFSYGTVLGSTFAAMFPDKVERLIIDGVVDVSDDYYTAQWTSNLRDTDKVLRWFFKDCLEAGPDNCAFYEPSVDAMNFKLNRLYDAIIESPVPVQTNLSYGIVDYARLRGTIFTSLYKPFDKWPQLATGLADLINGNGTALYAMADDARFKCSCDPLDRAFEIVEDATTAIACNDGDEVPSDLKSAQAHYENILKVSEWGSMWAGLRLQCVAWPKIPKTQFRGPIAGNTSFPLLVIGNAADPVTPLWAAHKVSKGFPGSVVLSQDSAGHCSLSSPSVCTARIIRNYFVNGTLPKAGTWCTIDGSPFDPPSSSFGIGEQGAEGAQSPFDSEDFALVQALRDLAMFDDRRMTPLHL